MISSYSPTSASLTAPTLDIEAISGILGSVSIACWVVVFTPQILENFRRRSAEGLSVVFIVIWLLGDIFNVLGSVLQGVLPTMVILAVYYTVADIVLLGQLWWYRGFTLSDEVVKKQDDTIRTNTGTDGTADERSALLPSASSTSSTTSSTTTIPHKPQPLIRTLLLNILAIVAVIASGILGWYISTTRIHTPSTQLPGGHRNRHETPSQHDSELQFNVLGQIFGYICAALYLGSRVPQLLLNYRRKSTEGLSLLFFCFAILGNWSYVGSILAYEPLCARESLMGGERARGGDGRTRCEAGEAKRLYARYMLINLSWFIGSFGTLWLDGFVFVQYMWYRRSGGEVTV